MRLPTRTELAYLALGAALVASVGLVLAGTLRPPPPTGVYLTQEHAESVTAAYDRLQQNFTRLRSEADTNRAGLLFLLSQFGCTDNPNKIRVVRETWTGPTPTLPKNGTVVPVKDAQNALTYREVDWFCRSPLGDNLTVPFATAYGTGARRWELP